MRCIAGGKFSFTTGFSNPKLLIQRWDITARSYGRVVRGKIPSLIRDRFPGRIGTVPSYEGHTVAP